MKYKLYCLYSSQQELPVVRHIIDEELAEEQNEKWRSEGCSLHWVPVEKDNDEESK